jgi:hypothetical protein
MVQWPFRTAGINAPSPTAPALVPPRKRVCYWLTRLKRHLGGSGDGSLPIGHLGTSAVSNGASA